MEKDALLEIIIHDLKEVEAMAENAKGETPLSKAYFKLTRNRIKSILEEIEMLEELSLPDNNTSQSRDADAEIKNISPPEISDKKEETENETIPQPSATTEDSAQKKSPVKEAPDEKEDAPDTDKSQSMQTTPETPVTESQEEEKSTSEHKETTQALKSESQENKKKENKVLGEKLKKENASFNEQLGKTQKSNSHKHSFSTPPITDLKKAMGINDRFFFQRELFNGSADIMSQTLEQLNQMGDINEAHNFLLANFNWDPENEAVLSFMELVERRYY
jgi:chemotaxis protein histidine kinase CheA